jgi:hypothetical protein
MSRHATRHNKRDLNETIIVNTLHELHVTWIEAGPLDGWVFLGQWIPIEIKQPTGRLTKGQQDFIDACQHFNRPVDVWRSAQDAVNAVLRHRGSP